VTAPSRGGTISRRDGVDCYAGDLCLPRLTALGSYSVITIPLSLIGTFIAMLILGSRSTCCPAGFGAGHRTGGRRRDHRGGSVNRHMEGMRPRDAAIKAARELANPIIAMTVVLIAVYVPIGFQGGLTGALLPNSRFTVVGAVTMSPLSR